ncbi:MAG: imidazole glycerol phosphate synthase subunit HisH [Bacteroidetes bacterium HGW-Bacteroidetes-17]|jgi:glutamine amidotransferase|nr:MAG: imidazole glycerol phosphate synthase subunit HisH [Bacteroidetes bacterium HGW-Bacteroidetes-17]
MKIGIIDYGSGNFTSVWNAVGSLSKEITRITKKEDFNGCSHIILPGVGAYGAAANKIFSLDLYDTLHNHVLNKKVPFLGICVGMQLLSEKGFEHGEHSGFGWVKGNVKVIEFPNMELPLPHMGWNSLTNMNNSPLFKDIENDATFYFVHSYFLQLETTEIKTVNVEYGITFPAALSLENIHGVQFHPEKSQFYGMKLLKNFIKLC